MNTKNTIKTVRAIESAPERTLIYFNLLMSKYGMTVESMCAAINKAVLAERIGERRGESFTPHNAYSLGLLANTYGQDFCSFRDDKGVVRYMFRSELNKDLFDAHYPEFEAMLARKASKKRKAQRDADKAEREAQAMRDARKAEREARKQASKPVEAPSVPSVPSVPSEARKAPRKPSAPISLVASQDAQQGSASVRGAKA